MPSPRVIISGGGTGGHIFPAIAIADALKKLDEHIEILFVGAKGRMEMEKIPKAGYQIVGLNISGIQRKLTLKNLKVPFKIFGSMLKARTIIKKFKPGIAVGVGGYASGPTLRMASLLGIPIVIQEQNSFPGITNRILSKKAARIFCGFSGMEKHFPKEKIVVTGNPVREQVLDLEGKKTEALQHFQLESNKKTLLIVGGSLGARTLNESVVQNIKQIASSGIQVIWQTGKFYYKECASFISDQGVKNVKTFEFIQRMDLAFAIADLTISRAGAMAISELSLVGMPAILVPSPNVSEDHQTKNALTLTQQGAAEMVEDRSATKVLIEHALRLINDDDRLNEMSSNTKALAKSKAAEKIADEIMSIVNN